MIQQFKIITQRKVPKEEGENFCLSNKVPFLEVSTLKVINARETFLSVAKGLQKYNKSGKNKGKKVLLFLYFLLLVLYKIF